MFSFSNRNRTTTNINADEIRDFLNKHFSKPQIDYWIDDQILFQVMHAKYFVDHGFQANTNDFAIVHFFNKNKTYSLKTWQKFQENQQTSELFYFEEPKGYHNYLKNIGSEPTNMEMEINKALDFYELEPHRTIRFEMNSY